MNSNNFEVFTCKMLKGDGELRASIVEVSPEGKAINEPFFTQASTPEDLADALYMSGSLDRKPYKTKNDGVRVKKSRLTGKINFSKSSCGKMAQHEFEKFTLTLQERMKQIQEHA